MGLKLITKYLKKIDENFDAYIIDFIFSSSTSPILKSDKPVIFIDLGVPEILPEAKDLIKKRCYYIKATNSEDARLNIDWNILDKILKNKEHYIDMSFPDKYYKDVIY